MTNEETIFAEALGKGSASERDTYLAKACAGNAELRRDVEALLIAHERAGGILEAPPVGLDVTREVSPSSGLVGSTVGPYKVLQQIGEGGMAVVFLAEQTRPIQRKVALKIIKPGMDSRMVIARFEAERQALAVMDHANIAKVLEAGTTDSGRPYFVMELVKGVPITKYCDEHHLKPRDRLELFVQVCSAVQHAHTKGIIHRDLKPSNVLVALYDGRPVPKVIDFGIAKATGQPLTERTLFTGFGAVVGTPEYMSPEQAELNQLDVDTRSDIYSLGVLLYELLTGSTPLEHNRFKAAALLEMLRVVREEEPPKPSTRLSTSTTLPAIAACRGLEPKKLSVLVHGELDWIVMKSLEKDRNRRYETANGFATDVQRYLDDEAVLACPPTRTYRMKKFMRRNKAGVLAGSAIVAALALGMTLASIGFLQARRQAVRADRAAVRATAVSDFLQQMLQSANPDELKGQKYTLRQLLDDFSAGLTDHLASQPEVEADVQQTIGRAYRRLDANKSEQHLRRAMELRRSLVGDQHEEFADSMVDYAIALRDQSRPGDAEPYLRRALAIYQKQGTRGKKVIRALQILQMVLQSLLRLSEIEPVVDQAVAIANQSPDEQFPEIASIYHALIAAKIEQSKYADAEALGRKCVELHLRLHGQDHPETGWGYYNLAHALAARQKFAEAIEAFQQALAVFQRALPAGTGDIILTLEALTREGLTSALQLAGQSDRLVEIFDSPRKLDELAILYRESLPENMDLFQGDPRVATAVQIGLAVLADIHLKLGAQFAAAGKTEQAKESSARAQALREELRLLGPKVAEQVKARGRQLLERDPADPVALNLCAWFLTTAPIPVQRDPTLAVALAAKGLRLGPNDGDIWRTVGVAQYHVGEWQNAVEALGKSMELRRGGDAFDWFFLAMAHWQLGDKEEARKLYDKAIEWTNRNRPRDEQLRRFRTEADELLKISNEKPTTKPQSK